MHLFSHEGVGIKRFETGKVRRLVGWLDREHILWQSDEGKLWCGRLGNNYSKRCVEDRIWSWVSRLDQGRLLLQTSSGEIWEGVLIHLAGIILKSYSLIHWNPWKE